MDTEPDLSSDDSRAIDPLHAARVFRACRPLPWPASRIGRVELHRLWALGQETGRPVTALVHEAVTEYLAARQGGPFKSAADGEQTVHTPSRRVADG